MYEEELKILIHIIISVFLIYPILIKPFTSDNTISDLKNCETTQVLSEEIIIVNPGIGNGGNNKDGEHRFTDLENLESALSDPTLTPEKWLERFLNYLQRLRELEPDSRSLFITNSWYRRWAERLNLRRNRIVNQDSLLQQIDDVFINLREWYDSYRPSPFSLAIHNPWFILALISSSLIIGSIIYFGISYRSFARSSFNAILSSINEARSEIRHKLSITQRYALLAYYRILKPFIEFNILKQSVIAGIINILNRFKNLFKKK